MEKQNFPKMGQETNNYMSSVSISKLNLNVMSDIFLQFRCLGLKESASEPRKMLFISLPKPFLFLRYRDFRIIESSRRHRMPIHESRNTLLNNSGSKHSPVMKFGQFI